MALISIAMTTYNGEKYLQDQLDSIFLQTLSDWELEICDDCSTDKTWEILTEYSKKDSRVHIHKNEQNLGFKKNFEKAISFCSGTFIALSDQDDIWKPNHLEFLFSNLKDKSLSAANALLIDSRKNSLNKTLNEADNFFSMPEGTLFLYRLIFMGGCVQGASQLMPKSFLDKCLPIPEEIKFHDVWFAVCALLCNGISYSFDEIVTLYRQHGNNITYDMHNKKKRNIFTIIKSSLEKFSNGLETDRFCYFDELSRRFSSEDENFRKIRDFYNKVYNRKISFGDILFIWNNYENITTKKGHKYFLRRIIGWLRMRPFGEKI